MKKFLIKNRFLILILLIGFFLRIYKPFSLFAYGHDEDLAGWIVKDILVNKHLRLIGQETSSHGVFIGPWFYYLQIPFFLLNNMDPGLTIFLPVILSVFAIFSLYFVLKDIFNEKVGLIASLIYSLSTVIVFTDREVVPTMPVALWTIWFFYGLNRILKGKNYGYLLIAFLSGFIWSLNLALVILLPLVVVAQVLSKKKINFKEVIVSFFLALFLNIPFLAFEIRHDFQQVKALIDSLVTNKDYVEGTSYGLAKLDRVMQLVHRNTTSIFWGSVLPIPAALTFYSLVLGFVFLISKKIISQSMAVLMFLWQALYFVFFTLNSINISEYYLNGMNIIWILISSLLISYFLANQNLRKIGIAGLIVFVSLNLLTFFMTSGNKSGFIERKAIVNSIYEDSQKRGFPCVSISYITSPGNNLGYRYLIWNRNLKVKPISEKVPVYSIVFPHSLVDSIDQSFGSLALVLPDYKRYTKDEVSKSCEGDDWNLTESMFGYTQ